MRILMVAPGTRGDVAPLTGLGAALTRDHRFDVSLAANPAYRELAIGSGARFHALDGDMSALVSPAAPGTKPRPVDIRRYLAELTAYLDHAATGTLAAAQAGADLILANGISPYAYDIGEALGIPVIGAHLQPLESSSAHPPMALGLARSLTGPGNRLLGTLMAAARAPYDRPSARIRSELGLPPRSRRASEALRRRHRSPILHGFSPSVVPRPRDWHAGLETTSYWWPHVDPGWTPEPRLVEFLAAGPPPVFIGFGSTAAHDTQFMLDVASRAGVRAVLQGAEGVDTAHVLGIGDVPHAWLFPRMAAAVHHAGAGTTAAALRAGIPSVGVPVFTDQPFWAARVHALGAGPAPVPYAKATVGAVASAVAAAIRTPSFAERARHLAGLIAREDGVAPVVRAIRHTVD
ncbi:glycosyltransferase [Arthrobacter sp.]|uniref:glycosyltransferase n=1 Tax=Arthrobacter sp. TaxID=1667 RepID=UPI003A90493F